MILTLQSDAELADCRAVLRRRGLDFSDPARARFWRLLYRARFRMPLPPADPLKSWDVRHALELIEANAPDLGTPVLDMGCFNSEVVYALDALGYRDVHGCDLNPLCRWLPYWNRVHYACADLTHTPYPDGRFGAVTCLSVIEHGVPIGAMAAEAARLLRPGGLLVLTTDYDADAAPHAIDPQFRVFGRGWQVFTPEGLDGVIEAFAARGFAPLDLAKAVRTHAERPVHWNGRRYTFALVALRKSGG